MWSTMKNNEWVLVDTETTGFVSPIFVVELAAQRMKGWFPEGPPFRHMLNHGADIPPEASRVHGYTREILERDGDAPQEVYRDFAEYIGDRPVSAYNLRYDWDEVLMPEWQRLGLSPCGTRGLCMMKLTQRLLDPVPAGNCKLQTLRQYYNLPTRGAHTALGDVETVIDLAQQVLRPMVEARGLMDWAALVNFSEALWFPARIPFGKFKGRLFFEARTDTALHGWLEWLASSSHQRSSQMGRWYLDQLNVARDDRPLTTDSAIEPQSLEKGIVVFGAVDIARLKALIEGARARLAELQAVYTAEHHAVSVTQAKLFELLRPLFQKRDQLRLRLDYRQKYLETLLTAGEEEAQEVEEELEHAQAQSETEYEKVASETAGVRHLSGDEEAELKGLWRKLVKLFHPDRFMDDEKTQIAYQKLTAEINRVRDSGDIARMREIASDPEGFMARSGWGVVTLDDSEDLSKLRYLYEELEGQVLALIETLEMLHQSVEHELHQMTISQPDLLTEVARKQSEQIEKENAQLEAELEELEDEIRALQQ